MQRKDVTTRHVLEAYDFIRRVEYEQVHGLLSRWLGCHWKVAYAAMEREEDRGNIECGVALHAGWLTAKGRAKLAELRERDGPICIPRMMAEHEQN